MFLFVANSILKSTNLNADCRGASRCCGSESKLRWIISVARDQNFELKIETGLFRIRNLICLRIYRMAFLPQLAASKLPSLPSHGLWRWLRSLGESRKFPNGWSKLASSSWWMTSINRQWMERFCFSSRCLLAWANCQAILPLFSQLFFVLCIEMCKNLRSEELKEEFDMKKFGDRKKLMERIENLKEKAGIMETIFSQHISETGGSLHDMS